MNSFVIKGDICYSTVPEKVTYVPGGYIVCVNGISQGVFNALPQEYAELPLEDYSGKLVIPGLIDLHVHASQYAYRGTGMDLELLDWLEKYAFPEETKFADLEYAKAAYGVFVSDLKKGATTRACIFATVHREATLLLMDMLEDSGLVCAVGKVNMDRNSADALQEATAESAEETRLWLQQCVGRYRHTRPIVTPRFVPSCTDELLQHLGELMAEYNVDVQSHLSENLKEIEWVKELCPWSKYYGDVYSRFNMFGGKQKSVMAHCIWSGDEELALMKKNGVFAVHCPQSNTNVVAGIAPVKKYLDMGLKLGLGSDVAGGSSLSVLYTMAEAIRCSKLRWRHVDSSYAPLKMDEAFYMATKGGGEYFGKVGSFEAGYELDAVVIDDRVIATTREFDMADRLERVIYLSSDENITAKYVAGNKIE